MSKLVFSETLAKYKEVFPNWALATDPAYRAIAFTKDGYIITHGVAMKTSADGGAGNPWGLSLGLSGQTLTVGLDGVTQSVTLPVIDVVQSTALTVTKAAGVYTVKHNNIGTAGTSGATAAANTTISVPKVTVDEQGHVSAHTQFTATLNQVKQAANTTTTKGYLLFGAGTSESAITSYASTIYVNAATGALTASSLYGTTLYEGGTSLAAKYAPIAHASTGTSYGIGTSANYGHVKLSDANDSTSGASAGIAATPNAVKTALDAAKLYASSLFSANDAMVLAGTVDASTGIITAVNTNVVSGVVVNTTKLIDLKNYKAGWNFKVAKAGTIAGIGALEVNDVIIIVNGNTAFTASDFIAIQTNIDGAVISPAALTENQVILGAGGQSIKALANGSNGQVLKINASGIPTWSTDVNTDTWRAIQVNGSQILANNVNTALNLVGGTGISLSNSGGSVTFTTDLLGLTINSSGVTKGVYDMAAKTNGTLNFADGIVAELVSGVFNIGHANKLAAQTTSAVRSFTYDANGHITASSVVTTLPNAHALTYGVSGTTTTYTGAAAKTLTFAGASGTDCSIATSFNTTSGVVTITPSITHRYRALKVNGTAHLADNVATALDLKAGANVSLSATGGVVTISSTDTNTWRNVTAYTLSNTSKEVLSSSIGTKDLEFGGDFIWDEATNPSLHIGWAEIDAAGTVTYAI